MKYLLMVTMALVLSACGMMPERSTSSTSSASYSDVASSNNLIPDTGNGD